MESYTLKKEPGTKRYRLEVGVKTECNVNAWCHVYLCIKNFFYTTHKPSATCQ